MRRTLTGIIGAAMIILAGCSSKSAVSTDETSRAGYGSGMGGGTGAGAGVSVEDIGQGGKAGSIIGDIFFDFDSSALSSEAQEQLNQNAAWMQKNPTSAVIIEGHCDERGTDEYNIALGERRAEAARMYLVNLGVSGGRLSTVSYGEEKPFDPGHNEEAWAKNRRDHFVVK
ncbi:MAG TPA: peptidoglycan-associated lipoprotein Pal [Chlorobaculum sp.]|uniref:Peptidoglycan-associated lipoprotein n=1 Tax=Chlorobaculum tepidum (strain ATCC 49652 / DSM 12025 / NBRC 103806 / TLS) TaxID=194439 RepID=Q8KEP8_CHLTE|nr:peptidoglycan-associated lipoprotein Pal [Chlorobaculum tepidum]AAM71877.1 peptidoglycan-associated lipoprotein [Chlorobaculum tepidum TLS]HBU22836.1 peptidoglycan-associated lipoprotein Pal [Chlorobaculum sp.]